MKNGKPSRIGKRPRTKRGRYSLHDSALRRLRGTFVEPTTGALAPKLTVRSPEEQAEAEAARPRSQPENFGDARRYSVIVAVDPQRGVVRRQYGACLASRRAPTPTRSIRWRIPQNSSLHSSST